MNRVKELRESKGIRQIDLAKKLNISQGTLSNWERCVHDPDNESLMQLSEIFDVSLDYLMGKPETSLQRDANAEHKINYDDTNPITGKKMTKLERNQLGDVLQNAQALFYDDKVSDDDKERFLRDITEMFWEAKEMNRRKKI